MRRVLKAENGQLVLDTGPSVASTSTLPIASPADANDGALPVQVGDHMVLDELTDNLEGVWSDDDGF